MIELAVNWSPALAALFTKVQLPVEYLKPLSASDAALARRHRPLLWHRQTRIGVAGVGDIQDAHGFSQARYLSLQLDVQPEDLKNGANAQAAQQLVVRNVRVLAQHCPIPLALENMPHYGWSERGLYITDPVWIGDTLALADANLLLDIARARVAAHHRREEFAGYLAKLPLERVVELHVSSPRLESDGLRDRHLALTATDYTLIEELLPKLPKLQLLTLEYGGIADYGYSRDGCEVKMARNDKNLLLEQLARLDTLRKRANGTLGSAQMLPVGWHLDNGWDYEYLQMLEFAA
jgi:hypothetical protein